MLDQNGLEIFAIEFLPVQSFALIAFREEIIKGKSHKYVKRVPYIKNGKKRYRYYYRLPSGGIVTKDSLVEGSGFRHGSGEERGHYHIKQILDGGEKVVVYHDVKGKKEELTLTFDEFRKMIHEGTHEQPGGGGEMESVTARGQRLLETYKQALLYGSKKQKELRLKALKEHIDGYDDVAASMGLETVQKETNLGKIQGNFSNLHEELCNSQYNKALKGIEDTSFLATAEFKAFKAFYDQAKADGYTIEEMSGGKYKTFDELKDKVHDSWELGLKQKEKVVSSYEKKIKKAFASSDFLIPGSSYISPTGAYDIDDFFQNEVFMRLIEDANDSGVGDVIKKIIKDKVVEASNEAYQAFLEKKSKEAKKAVKEQFKDFSKQCIHFIHADKAEYEAKGQSVPAFLLNKFKEKLDPDVLDAVDGLDLWNEMEEEIGQLWSDCSAAMDEAQNHFVGLYDGVSDNKSQEELDKLIQTYVQFVNDNKKMLEGSFHWSQANMADMVVEDYKSMLGWSPKGMKKKPYVGMFVPVPNTSKTYHPVGKLIGDPKKQAYLVEPYGDDPQTQYHVFVYGVTKTGEAGYIPVGFFEDPDLSTGMMINSQGEAMPGYADNSESIQALIDHKFSTQDDEDWNFETMPEMDDVEKEIQNHLKTSPVIDHADLGLETFSAPPAAPAAKTAAEKGTGGLDAVEKKKQASSKVGKLKKNNFNKVAPFVYTVIPKGGTTKTKTADGNYTVYAEATLGGTTYVAQEVGTVKKSVFGKSWVAENPFGVWVGVYSSVANACSALQSNMAEIKHKVVNQGMSLDEVTQGKKPKTKMKIQDKLNVLGSDFDAVLNNDASTDDDIWTAYLNIQNLVSAAVDAGVDGGLIIGNQAVDGTKNHLGQTPGLKKFFYDAVIKANSKGKLTNASGWQNWATKKEFDPNSSVSKPPVPSNVPALSLDDVEIPAPKPKPKPSVPKYGSSSSSSWKKNSEVQAHIDQHFPNGAPKTSLAKTSSKKLSASHFADGSSPDIAKLHDQMREKYFKGIPADRPALKKKVLKELYPQEQAAFAKAMQQWVKDSYTTGSFPLRAYSVAMGNATLEEECERLKNWYGFDDDKVKIFRTLYENMTDPNHPLHTFFEYMCAYQSLTSDYLKTEKGRKSFRENLDVEADRKVQDTLGENEFLLLRGIKVNKELKEQKLAGNFEQFAVESWSGRPITGGVVSSGGSGIKDKQFNLTFRAIGVPSEQILGGNFRDEEGDCLGEYPFGSGEAEIVTMNVKEAKKIEVYSTATTLGSSKAVQDAPYGMKDHGSKYVEFEKEGDSYKKVVKSFALLGVYQDGAWRPVK